MSLYATLRLVKDLNGPTLSQDEGMLELSRLLACTWTHTY